jgi:hypothetical protein
MLSETVIIGPCTDDLLRGLSADVARRAWEILAVGGLPFVDLARVNDTMLACYPSAEQLARALGLL